MNNTFENYKSPITVHSDFENQIIQEQDKQIMCKIRTVVDVDKQELIKALNYDRKQYETGYKEGVRKMRQNGHWIIKENRFGELTLQCSECNNIDKDYTLPHFCKFCGTIMDEVSEDVYINKWKR